MDVRERAEHLAEAIINSAEYKDLEQAKETVSRHEAARIMLKDFHAKQEGLQKQQMEGNPVSQSQAEDLRKLYEVLTINPYIRKLFEAEFKFGGMMMEVQDIITKSLGLNDDDDDDDMEENQEESPLDIPKQKLWIPGN